MNFIFNLTKRQINIAITKAVVIALPVLILDNILFPKNPSKEPLFAAVTSKCTILLFINNKNLINNGAKAIATPPNNNQIGRAHV